MSAEDRVPYQPNQQNEAQYPPPNVVQPVQGYAQPEGAVQPVGSYPPFEGAAQPVEGYPQPPLGTQPEGSYPAPDGTAQPAGGYPPLEGVVPPPEGCPQPPIGTQPAGGYPAPDGAAQPEQGFPPPEGVVPPAEGYPPPPNAAQPAQGYPAPEGVPQQDATVASSAMVPQQPVAPVPVGAPQSVMPYVPPMTAIDPDPEGLAALRGLEERRRRARRNRIIKIVVVCCVIAAALAIWIMSNVLSSTASPEAAPEVAPVVRTDLSSSVQATGSLNPSSHVLVSPEIPGTIEEVRVVEGQHVEVDDVLLTIKSTDLEKELTTAEQALRRAQRNLDSANASVDTAWNDYYRAIDEYNAAVANSNATALSSSSELDSLSGLGGMGEFDHSTYLAAIDAAQDGVQSAQDAVEDAQSTYDAALKQADKRTVRSTIAGTVLDLKATAGAVVGGTDQSSSGALMEIADLTKLSVDIEVNEIDIDNVKVGQPATITFSALPGLELKGSVASVASVATSSSNEGATSGGIVTFKVTVTVDQSDDRLKPGMSATVNVQTKDVPDVLVVPAAAVTEDGDSAFVFVVADEMASDPEMREVVVGERSGSQVAVTSGLKEGELVLVSAGESGSSAASSSASAAL